MNTSGALRIARIFGIDVFVHWSWAVVAMLELSYRAKDYSSFVWNALEYLSLFGIVLMHEFGHSLACRSVGGVALRIVLWPLGGVAYVDPPQRPGAVLWSIAAGPLVNVVLVPVTILAAALTGGLDTNIAHFFTRLATLNIVLLVFNMLPFYPLDGGQIVRALAWFVVGRARSLAFSAIIGLFGAAAIGAFAAYTRSAWLGVLAAFNALRSWGAYKGALALREVEKAPRRHGAACPSCRAAPPVGPFWVCPCRSRVDLFEPIAACGNCRRQFADALCLDCHVRSPLVGWSPPPILRGRNEPAQESAPPA